MYVCETDEPELALTLHPTASGRALDVELVSDEKQKANDEADRSAGAPRLLSRDDSPRGTLRSNVPWATSFSGVRCLLPRPSLASSALCFVHRPNTPRRLLNLAIHATVAADEPIPNASGE